jgi:hypothetical protein
MNADPTELLLAIAQAGRENPSAPSLHLVEPFQHYFDEKGHLQHDALDWRDGALTRREALTRFLLLNAVLDQGPDIIGLRQMLIQVTNELYRREVRFLHKPLLFFQEIGLAIDEILTQHQAVKKVRAAVWAAENRSNANRYNLFMDNAHQVLGYAIFRWGVPLALPYLLEKDARRRDYELYSMLLLDYLESYSSTEQMTIQLKEHPRYGLGKAIGDKAAHLFGKWLVSIFRLTRRAESGWKDFSYEVPYDSNAGRVLWRTGYLLNWASEATYQQAGVLRPGVGKGRKTYIRVTNLRGMRSETNLSPELHRIYGEICTEHLRSHRRLPKKVEIQRIQHAYLWRIFKEHGLAIADFDDGLIAIGTQFCYNHSQPRCTECPINRHCAGYQDQPKLIEEYRT